MTATGVAKGAVDKEREALTRPLLSVVVPVYNGGAEIVANVGTIRAAAAAGLAPEDVEIVVVSDGSIDGTAERLLEARSDVDMRVIHYDRNLGKGYAVKLGTLSTRGDWVALVDADLDLDPASIPLYLDIARRDRLDLAVGSKRHPDSDVDYPPLRRFMSWCYQQLTRALLGLAVRDTQVGLKVFSRDVADEVVPLLLVKRFAFDLELLAVATALGRDRVRELPVRLRYRFTGSGVGSRAILRALVDTAALVYRLRILKTYQRKRELLRPGRLGADVPTVTVVGDVDAAARLDYPVLELADSAGGGTGELVAVVAEGVRPAGNWVSAAVPYLRSPAVAAVVVPSLAPMSANPATRAAAAVLESRLGAGSRRSRFFPGNVRVTADFPASTVVIRRRDWEDAVAADVEADALVGWLASRGRQTVYTPDSMIVAAPAPLFRPHLRETLRHGRARGFSARRTRGRSVSGATALSLVPPAVAVVGLVSLAPRPTVGLVLLAVYTATLAAAAALAGLRFRSARVAMLVIPGLVLNHLAYVAGFVAGAARRPSLPSASARRR